MAGLHFRRAFGWNRSGVVCLMNKMLIPNTGSAMFLRVVEALSLRDVAPSKQIRYLLKLSRQKALLMINHQAQIREASWMMLVICGSNKNAYAFFRFWACGCIRFQIFDTAPALERFPASAPNPDSFLPITPDVFFDAPYAISIAPCGNLIASYHRLIIFIVS